MYASSYFGDFFGYFDRCLRVAYYNGHDVYRGYEYPRLRNFAHLEEASSSYVCGSQRLGFIGRGLSGFLDTRAFVETSQEARQRSTNDSNVCRVSNYVRVQMRVERCCGSFFYGGFYDFGDFVIVQGRVF